MNLPLGPLFIASALIGIAVAFISPEAGIAAGVIFFVLYCITLGVLQGMREGLRPTECAGCGYSLADLPRAGKCPECGRAIRG